MLTIWGRSDSSRAQALMWGVGELGLPCRRIDAGHRFGVVDTPPFLAMNPSGTVPVLRDGDGPCLWESGAILRCLANCYGRALYWPDEPDARTDIDRWAEWAKLNVALGFTGPVFWRVVRIPADRRDPGAIAAALTALATKLRIAEDRLARHDWLAGDDLTLADIPFGHVLHRYFDIDIDRPDLPALAAYHARLTRRPAFRQHVMVSYDALRA